MKTAILLVLSFMLITTGAFGTGGDMGANTEPLTDGSATYPYLIEDLTDFDVFAADPNFWVADIHTKLACDSNLTGRTYTTAVIAPDTDNTNHDDFDGTPFEGSFDGGGHVISNLTIDAAGTSNDYLGLFGKTNIGSKIKDFTLESVSVIGAGNYAGGLVGDNYGDSITNCYSTGSVSGDWLVGGLVGSNNDGIITNCSFTGSVSNTHGYAGGLVGYSWGGSITNCYSTGSVSGNSSESGGLVGSNSSIVINCYSTASVDGTEMFVGGLVGVNGSSGIVTNCYSTGSVSGTNYAGGLVGRNWGNVTNCYSTGSVSSTGSDVGGLAGKNNVSIANCYFLNTAGPDNRVGVPLSYIEMKQQSSFSGWDFIDETANGTSQIWQMQVNGYPVLSNFNGYLPVPLNGTGTEFDPFLINSANELGAIYHYDSRSSFRLQSSIDLTSIQWSTPIVPVFRGSFNGNGFAIQNMYIEGGNYLALFGIITSLDAKIKNLGIEDCTIFGTGAYISKYVGGLVGYSYGDVTNCYSTGLVSARGADVGGLVGKNNGDVTNSYSTCSVSSTGYTYAGGLVGGNYDDSIIANSYSTGSVSGYFTGGLVGYNSSSAIVTECYSAGSVSGTYAVEPGGLVGYNDGGTYSGCFWDATVNPDVNGIGNATDPNVIGKTTTEMQTKSTFTDAPASWDFVNETDNGIENVWRLCVDEIQYPTLNWQNPAGDLACPDGVSTEDLLYFSFYWLDDTLNALEGGDLTGEGDVTLADFAIFAKHWLEGVE